MKTYEGKASSSNRKPARCNVNGVLADRVQDLIRRLEVCKKRLLRWSKKEFPNFMKVVEHLRQQLVDCSKGVMTAEKLSKSEELVAQIEGAWDQEEVYWWQRSRIAWLNCGDRNTKFFHTSVIQRRQRNKLLRLKDVNGVWLEDRAGINKTLSDFYQNLFRSEGLRPMDQAIAYVKAVVSTEDNDQLTRLVTDTEIEGAVFQIGSSKAPGPDGYLALFYQTAWVEVKTEVCAMVQAFFSESITAVTKEEDVDVLLPTVIFADHFVSLNITGKNVKPGGRAT
ncbi:hypothetical protein K1719_037083 [Acacia pycnantha]|nr:hypothetical protein K1719_037083 [Acacia pycnantha]